ncbi:5-hydroxytryptamine receptor 2A [Alosa sapidissima]|uniref:5-hydroxytryptamine receptor 2A n=1 Tax=Alosa sapidissima TaxID=34773 RepID=UPI001C084F5A|nr:5-hydroxytryptamine receptor 2A [Alosa sapidissima]XP_041936662.1 5-hydroxytryptamine receptor 2A [Alosa sapidissima]
MRVEGFAMMARQTNQSKFMSSVISAMTLPPFGSEMLSPEVEVVLGYVVHNESVECNRTADANKTSGSGCVVSTATQTPKNWAALLILAAIIITVMGNILVIMAVTLERKLQNATNYFLMSLAAADLLLGLLVMPIAMVNILYDYSWPLPSTLCPIWIFLDVLLSTASIMHLCAISLDRYIGIRNPIHHSRSNSRTKARIKIGAAWTVSVVISLPVPVLGLQNHSKFFQGRSCQMTDDSFVLIGSFVAFFIPLIIMLVTYFLTISTLQSEATVCLDQLVPRPMWASALGLIPRGSVSSERLFLQRSLSRDGGDATAVTGVGVPFGRRTMQSISNEQKASKVLGVVFFLFVIMWCPFFVTNVLAVVCDAAVCPPDLMGALLNVFVWVGYMSSAVNPLVYTLFNKTYRAAFARYVRCRCREQRRPLQFILVNTIPPLAYSSSQMHLRADGTLRRDTEPSGLGGSIGMNALQSSKCSGYEPDEISRV